MNQNIPPKAQAQQASLIRWARKNRRYSREQLAPLLARYGSLPEDRRTQAQLLLFEEASRAADATDETPPNDMSKGSGGQTHSKPRPA